MSVQENSSNNFNWLYYALGLVFGILTAVIITQSYIYAILGGILGLLSAGLFLNAIVKGRKY
jgi:ABC-type antimicrobial peptide transport system permease subunit